MQEKSMIETFYVRAKKRNKIAYLMLLLSVTVILIGIVAVLYMVFSYKVDIYGAKKSEVENYKFMYISSVSFFLGMLFFVSQALIKLYRYNILKGDYYYVCADSLKLAEDYSNEKQKRFDKLLKLLVEEKINLSTPKTPNFSFFNFGKKNQKEA